MSRKKQVKDQIELFLNSTKKQRLEMLTFGVEIETQASDGSDDFWSTVYEYLDREDYMDADRFYSDIHYETVKSIQRSSIEELVGHAIDSYSYCLQPYIKKEIGDRRRKGFETICKYEARHQLITQLQTEIIEYAYALEQRAISFEVSYENTEIAYRALKKFKRYFLRGEFPKLDTDQLESSIEAPWFEDIEQAEMESAYYIEDQYYYDEDDIRSNFPHLFNDFDLKDSKNLEIGEDESVSGVEIRTIGGLSNTEFEAASKSIFDSLKDSSHYVDTDCSAHLHIKLGDIKHFYGDGNLHAAIMEYLTFNLDRLPKSVLKRVQKGNRWIFPYLSEDKFRWIHFHDQGTIEFRLFGNIDDLDDLLACRDLAIEALAYGYQVRFGDYLRALENDYIENLLGRIA